MGAVSLGYGPNGQRIRRKVCGKTKQEVRDKLRALHHEIEAGVRTSRHDTVVRRSRTGCGMAWTVRRSEPTLSMKASWNGAGEIGARRPREPERGRCPVGAERACDPVLRRSLQITRNCLERAIRQAEANDLVGRNVAALVKTDAGRDGRPSKSFTVDQAKALLAAAKSRRLQAYVALSLMVGLRTEEARALRWDHVVAWVENRPAGCPSPRPDSTPLAGRRPLCDLCVACGATWRGHQDREVATNPGAAAAVRGGATPAAGTARARPTAGR